MLEGALSLISAASILIGMCAIGRAFYCLAKRMEWAEGAERKLWSRRYYGAMLTFLVGWSVAALTVGVKYLLGFPVSSTIGQ